MDKSGISRWLLIGGVLLAVWLLFPKILGGGGGSDGEVQPLKGYETSLAPPERRPEETCRLRGKRFEADLSTRGAAVLNYHLVGDPKYTDHGKPMNLPTVLDPLRQHLRFDWRAPGLQGDLQGDAAAVRWDEVDWTLADRSDTSCTFAWRDDRVALTKTVRVGDGPYELVARATIENLSAERRSHRLGVEATAWRTKRETEPGLGRQSPFVTEVVCAHDGGKIERKSLSDFSADAFSKPGFEKGWFVVGGAIEFAATTNAYFAQALVPVESPAPPACALQVEERWHQDRFGNKRSDDPDYGGMYRSRLLYPVRDLSPGEKATYEVLSYLGPKDRQVLGAAAGGRGRLTGLINLGYFAIIAQVLQAFLVRVHGVVGNWGIAIVVLTLCVRILLFPLTWKQIKSAVAMRRLKPEIDELNRRFKDDMQQKNLAMMELWRKHGVNPLSGCLPALAQLPVWWALYTTLQTAVELYHVPFLWFPDLSAADPFYVLPFILGGTTFAQQKIMPQQMDPMQQKMMLYFIPGLFTVMMLFLPSGLGIYILTNSVLGIAQQLLVEKFAGPMAGGPARGIEVRDKAATGAGAGAGAGAGKKKGGGGSKLLPATPEG